MKPDGRERERPLLGHTTELGLPPEAKGEMLQDLTGRDTGRSLLRKTTLVTCREFSEQEPTGGCSCPSRHMMLQFVPSEHIYRGPPPAGRCPEDRNRVCPVLSHLLGVQQRAVLSEHH